MNIQRYNIEEQNGRVVCSRRGNIITDPNEIIGPVNIHVFNLKNFGLPFSLAEMDVKEIKFQNCTVDLSCAYLPSFIPELRLVNCMIKGRFDKQKRISVLIMDSDCFVSDVDGFNRMLDVDIFQFAGVGKAAYCPLFIPYSTRIISDCLPYFDPGFADALLSDHPNCKGINLAIHETGLQDFMAFIENHREQLDLRYYLHEDSTAAYFDVEERIYDYLRENYGITTSLRLPRKSLNENE